MRCAKCLKIMRYATVCSQIWERTDKNAIILLLFYLLCSLLPTHTTLSLSPLWSPSLRCSLFLSHFFFFLISHSLPFSLHFGIIAVDPTRLCAFLSLSLSLFFPVTISLSFFSCHEEEGDSDLKQSLPIETCQSEPLLTQGQSPIFARRPPQSPIFASCHEEEGDSDLKQSSPIEACQSEPLLADLKLCSPRGSCRSLLVILHNSRRRSRHWWLVEFGHWLICWVGFLLKILSYYYYFFYFVEVFGFGICWRIR